MPSIGTRVAQALPRAGFITVLNPDNGEPVGPNPSKYYLFNIVPKNGDNVSVLSDPVYVQDSGPVELRELGRDMGKRITLVDDNGLVSVILGRALGMIGPASEGVPDFGDGEITMSDLYTYVVAFTANPSDTSIGPVPGARTG
jgi:hypothetical protein